MSIQFGLALLLVLCAVTVRVSGAVRVSDLLPGGFRTLLNLSESLSR